MNGDVKRPLSCPYNDCDGDEIEMVEIRKPPIDDDHKWHQDEIAVKSYCYLCRRFWLEIYTFDQVVKLSREVED